MQTPGPKDTLRAISIFYYTLVSGLVMFTVIIFGLNFLLAPSVTDESTSRVLFIAVLVMTAICIPIAIRLYSKRMADIRSTQLDLNSKLDLYRSALILYMALCEFCGLFAVIVYFMTGNRLLIYCDCRSCIGYASETAGKI